MNDAIKVIKVDNETDFASAIGGQVETFDFCMCNPPFYGSLEEHNVILIAHGGYFYHSWNCYLFR